MRSNSQIRPNRVLDTRKLGSRVSRTKHKSFPPSDAGLGAGLFSVVLTSPFDVVKTRMQSKDSKLYSSTLDCFKQIAGKEGPAAFFTGALARSARVVPGQGIIFVGVDVFYDAIDSRVSKK